MTMVIYLVATIVVAFVVWVLLELAWKREIAFPYRVAITVAAAVLWPLAFAASIIIVVMTFVFSKRKK